jgi:hypothetical protein
MSTSALLTDLVRRLIDAENRKSDTDADKLLSMSFEVITRSTGKEQERAALLKAIKTPAKPGVQRTLVGDPWVRVSDGLGVVRSIVETTDSDAPGEPPKRHRNVHICVLEADDWRCIAWQVTTLA